MLGRYNFPNKLLHQVNVETKLQTIDAFYNALFDSTYKGLTILPPAIVELNCDYIVVALPRMSWKLHNMETAFVSSHALSC